MGKTIFIAILRGINVNGQKKILMADLKDLLEAHGFKQVQTYIQSGNVIFQYPGKYSNVFLARKIAKAIFGNYKFEVPVIVRKWEELNKILADNPFLKEKELDESKLHVTFLAEIPAEADVNNIRKINYLPDRFVLQGNTVYLYCPVNYGETKLSNKFFEQKLKVHATTRNWKTVNKLVEMGRLS